MRLLERLERLGQWVLDRLLPAEPLRPFRAVTVADVPAVMRPGTVYLVGEGDHRWCATLRCPCGCRATIQLGMLREARPRWSATVHADSTVSLAPSVWRRVGCRSHFVLERGRVRWCGPAGQRPRSRGA